MKSAIVSIIILLLLTTSSILLSVKQEKVLVPIYYTLKDITESEDAKAELKECIDTFKRNAFLIGLSVPSDDYDKVDSCLREAEVYLEADEKALFSASIQSCLIYLSSILGYSDVAIDDIL